MSHTETEATHHLACTQRLQGELTTLDQAWTRLKRDRDQQSTTLLTTQHASLAVQAQARRVWTTLRQAVRRTQALRGVAAAEARLAVATAQEQLAVYVGADEAAACASDPNYHPLWLTE